MSAERFPAGHLEQGYPAGYFAACRRRELRAEMRESVRDTFLQVVVWVPVWTLFFVLLVIGQQ